MNILMVSLDFPPTVGGISAHVYELSMALSGLGHRVSVITRANRARSEPFERVGPLDVHRVRLRGIAPIYGWQINRFIDSLLPTVRPDIIHLHGLKPLEGYRTKTAPLVFTNHTTGFLMRVRKGGIRRMALLRRLLRKPRLLLAPSRERLEVPFPIPAEKRFIPNGVDADKYRRDEAARARLRAELGLAPEHVVAILTRRMVEKDGVIYFARAVSRVSDPSLRAVLIGHGPETPAVARALAEGFAGRYHLLGEKTHDEIIPYYSAADFSVLPSLLDATAISGLEAMACSLPLVGTRVGGIPELIEEGGNGYLCESADEADMARCIARLLASDHVAMGRRSRELVEERFRWSEIAAQTVRAYETVL
ncbi:MAG: glycosyltransferase family 4 protein [Gammaproteobacteria bacterium]|nr:glycosyltransferase family 4 protein [Gammaproteobacteria bacterium]